MPGASGARWGRNRFHRPRSRAAALSLSRIGGSPSWPSSSYLLVVLGLVRVDVVVHERLDLGEQRFALRACTGTASPPSSHQRRRRSTSCATVATSWPVRVRIVPSDRPRPPPVATGTNSTSNQSLTSTGRWNHTLWSSDTDWRRAGSSRSACGARAARRRAVVAQVGDGLEVQRRVGRDRRSSAEPRPAGVRDDVGDDVDRHVTGLEPRRLVAAGGKLLGPGDAGRRRRLVLHADLVALEVGGEHEHDAVVLLGDDPPRGEAGAVARCAPRRSGSAPRRRRRRRTRRAGRGPCDRPARSGRRREAWPISSPPNTWRGFGRGG